MTARTSLWGGCMKKINVLIIDDDPVSLKLFELILERNPNVSRILKATNGLDGLSILEKRFDTNLIILDLNMPIMNGIEFLINIQTIKYLSTIPIIATSTDDTLKTAALEQGAYDFLLKPVHIKDVDEKVSDILNLIF
ncbi:response regulator receiver domain-containing protein [Campylobacter hyointestinalis subsp. hyointestinalis]|uniref:Response regulator receiver domain-containing protein n=2 Tax=Campylobacter hyointestinalis subsp. hyointestinalis TaxID=91352 RepID=A0A9W5AUH4_CAMHY|nr:response regulator receiver domain-containing protein [Campylobacter hyointestinalis subsp. hyointestinalis]CUU87402.1 response regulator receiver domain-containing protein [Campylobacter hyointestinalis subsp. hyointestinalis]CUU88368.1 response regulator receiver domain-containing protein [Campylobacter hyointestinalis]CUU88771.1 response regulator receiver domain-containing protein [Campylobacter hyointestinalis subsp. hyointestinalis]